MGGSTPRAPHSRDIGPPARDARRWILVAAPSRSAVAALDRTLDGHAPSLGEAWLAFRPSRSHHLGVRCGCGAEPCPVWARLAGVPEAHALPRAFELLGGPVVVDASLDPCWILDAAQAARASGIVPIVLVLWTDPSEHLREAARRGVAPRQAAERFLAYHDDLFAAGLPTVAVTTAELGDRSAVLAFRDWLGLTAAASSGATSHRLGVAPDHGAVVGRLEEATGRTCDDLVEASPLAARFGNLAHGLGQIHFRHVTPEERIGLPGRRTRPGWYRRRRLRNWHPRWLLQVRRRLASLRQP